MRNSIHALEKQWLEPSDPLVRAVLQNNARALDELLDQGGCDSNTTVEYFGEICKLLDLANLVKAEQVIAVLVKYEARGFYSGEAIASMLADEQVLSSTPPNYTLH